MYKILKKDGMAKRAHMETVHGSIETPVFMNVGTVVVIKGAVSTTDLHEIKHRWSCRIRIIFMSVREIRLLKN